jgi:tetratricopeptide (TPR) repeat protein
MDIHWMREQNASYQETPEHIVRGSGMAAMLAGRRDFSGMLKQAHYFQLEKQWERAIECYKVAYLECLEKSPPDQRKVMMGLSRCLYEIGDYEFAMDMGKAVIEMNRYFQQVHKYVAMAQRESGDQASAIKTMQNAVLYEAPWDDKNKEANRDILQKMMME